MQVKGVIKELSAVEKGTSASGKEWQRQTVVIEVPDGQYPYDLAVEVVGDRVKYLDRATVGATAEFEVNVKSRAYNGKWFTKAEAWKVTVTPATDF